eukprot:TRINITY_DN1937_c0_g1_i1.p1 TRINITY_DN1937_c0_g1~~TRINITY_DN1937_c0_g1_i1.p1  ORF type:complete len:523 (+),score=233.04 TRINITY_DN1937_c0_g1_i1:25-1593(+)
MNALFSGRRIVDVTRQWNRAGFNRNFSPISLKNFQKSKIFSQNFQRNVRFNSDFAAKGDRSRINADLSFDKSDVVEGRGKRSKNIDDGYDEEDLALQDEEAEEFEEGGEEGEEGDEVDNPIFKPSGFYSMDDIYEERDFEEYQLTVDSPNRNLIGEDEAMEDLEREAVLDQLGRNEKFSYDERFVNVVESELMRRQRQIPFELDGDKKARVREALALYAKNPSRYTEMTPEKLEKMRRFSGILPDEFYHMMKPKPATKPLTQNEHEVLFRRFHPKKDEFFAEMAEVFLPEGEDLKSEEKLLTTSTTTLFPEINEFYHHQTSSKKRAKYEEYIKGRKEKKERVEMEKLKAPKSKEQLKEEEVMAKVNPYGIPTHRLNGFGTYFPHILNDFPREHVTWPLMYEYARVLSRNPTYSQEEKEKVVKEFKNQFLQVDVKAIKEAYKKMGLPTTFEKNIKLPINPETRAKWDEFMEQATVQYLDRNETPDWRERIHKRIVNGASEEAQQRMIERAEDVAPVEDPKSKR